MTTFVAMTLVLAANSTSGWLDRFRPDHSHPHQHQHHHQYQAVPHGGGHHKLLPDGGKILPPGPGDGWGFLNGNPDGYGWFDVQDYLPLDGDRTAEYFFPRYLAVPPNEMFIPTYYNPYTTRGQRYLPYAGAGGWHPAGGPPVYPAALPFEPKAEAVYAGEKPAVPTLNGRIEAKPTNSGTSGLTP